MQAGTLPQKTQEIGSAVDDFTLPDVHGGPRSLSEFLQGKRGAVVAFWSGICSHCVRYDGYFNSFAARHPEIALVTVASRHGETPEMIRDVMKDRELTFPILHDPGSAVAKQWFTQQTPRVFLLDGDRKLLYRGAIDNFKFPDDPLHEAYLEPAIAAFLAGQPVPRAETASFGCAIMSVYYILPKSV
ncbi:MAG TPA: redoxin domain-containing protein [Mycobacterium sp.]|nr:redoxin domain-containing protein [Mycobacterium sp.]